MFRWLRLMGRWFLGLFGFASDKLMENEHVLAATYDAAVEKGEARYQTLKTAVARQMSVKESKVEEVTRLSNETTQLEKIKAGAAGRAKQRVEALKAQGMNAEDIKRDAEVIKHQGAYQDASSTLTEKGERIKDLEREIKNDDVAIATYKSQLQSMQREHRKLTQEKSEAIADVQVAKQREEVNDLLAGIAKDTTDSDLSKAREARKNARNRGKIAAEMAGVDSEAADSAYAEYATNLEANSDFAALIGLEDAPVAKKELDPAKLPEA